MKQCKAKQVCYGHIGVPLTEYSCTYPVFSHEFCKIHQDLRTDDKYLEMKQKLLSKKKSIISKRYKKYPVEYEQEDNTSVGYNTEAQNHDLLLGGIKYQKALKAVTDKQNVLKRSPIKKQSSKGFIKSRKLQAIKKELIKENGYTCFFSGPYKGYLSRFDLFHIFPQGKYPQYATDKWNCVLSCRKYNEIWDNGTIEQILQIPNIEKVFNIIKKQDESPYKKHKGSFYQIIMNRKEKQ